jgi:hypothetical protein
MMKDIVVRTTSFPKLVIQYGVEPQSQLDGAPASEGARGCDGAAGGTTSPRSQPFPLNSSSVRTARGACMRAESGPTQPSPLYAPAMLRDRATLLGAQSKVGFGPVP